MITILDLARRCSCDPITVRRWVKKHKIQTQKVKAGNGKLVQAMSIDASHKFESHWKDVTSLPKNMVTVPDVAKANNVDRKTVRLWVGKNDIKIKTIRNSKHPPTQAMSIKDAKKFSDSLLQKNCVPVTEIIDQYNTNWNLVKRWAKRNKCEFVETRSEVGGRNKKALVIKDAKKLKKYLMCEQSNGFFYMVHPIPEFNKNRVKLGFARNVENRMKQHRCICPNASVIKKWKCKKEDEQKVISKATKVGCTQLYTEDGIENCATEVFDCEDYKALLNKLDEIFSKSEI